MTFNKDWLKPLQELVRQASDEIMAVYHSDHFGIQTKSDDSPVTKADLSANRLIMQRLAELTPDFPRLSEEQARIPFSQRRGWQSYWLIDPLDGTQEFIDKNDEFTINIALIHKGEPVFGIIHAPVFGETFWGGRALGGSWKQMTGQPVTQIHCRSAATPLIVTTSRRHGRTLNDTMRSKLREDFRDIRCLPLGSSLKMCRIAEGSADIYPRRGPTGEWDTGAAQALLEGAGGAILNAQFEPLRYNQRESLINPDFIAVGDPAFPLDKLPEDLIEKA